MTSLRLRWLPLMAAGLIGGLVCTLLAAAGYRSGLSYLGGLSLVVGAFEFGAFNIRLAGRYMPSMTMVVALFSYATTTIAFGLALVASSPRVVDGSAVATGLFVGIAIWIGAELAVSRPSQEPT
jgi:hypothetical protein